MCCVFVSGHTRTHMHMQSSCLGMDAGYSDREQDQQDTHFFVITYFNSSIIRIMLATRLLIRSVVKYCKLLVQIPDDVQLFFRNMLRKI